MRGKLELTAGFNCCFNVADPEIARYRYLGIDSKIETGISRLCHLRDIRDIARQECSPLNHTSAVSERAPRSAEFTGESVVKDRRSLLLRQAAEIVRQHIGTTKEEGSATGNRDPCFTALKTSERVGHISGAWEVTGEHWRLFHLPVVRPGLSASPRE